MHPPRLCHKWLTRGEGVHDGSHEGSHEGRGPTKGPMRGSKGPQYCLRGLHGGSARWTETVSRSAKALRSATTAAGLAALRWLRIPRPQGADTRGTHEGGPRGSPRGLPRRVPRGSNHCLRGSHAAWHEGPTRGAPRRLMNIDEGPGGLPRRAQTRSHKGVHEVSYEGSQKGQLSVYVAPGPRG